MRIRKADEHDAVEILALYRRVAATPGGIARLATEIDAAYVRGFLNQAMADGIALVIESDSEIVAEMHAYRPGLECFSQVLSNLTVVVDPSMQGQGLGRSILEAFLSIVVEERADINRVELIARESNEKALNLYRSLGFNAEGAFAARIKNVDGSLESDIPMAWLRH